MTLARAQHYAAKIVEWISPFCVVGSALPCGASIAVAGSIRRIRPTCNDIDIVCIPKTFEHKDMLGETLSVTNHVREFIVEYTKRNP